MGVDLEYSVETLIKNNANVNLTDYKGYSPLYLALKAGKSLHITAALISHIFISISKIKITHLFMPYAGHKEIARMLIVSGADLDLELGDWKSAIFWCVTRGDGMSFLFQQIISVSVLRITCIIG